MLKQHGGSNLYLKMAVFVAVFLLALAAQAQTTTAGSLAGSVVDTTGSTIPGAQVTLKNQGTGATVIRTTGSDSDYIFENLPDGDYLLTTLMRGVKTSANRDIPLNPGERRARKITLAAGDVPTQVAVQADAVAVRTTPSAASTTSPNRLSASGFYQR